MFGAKAMYMLAACAVMIPLVGCSRTETKVQAYELLVRLDTPGGPVSGTGVMQVRTRHYKGIEGKYTYPIIKGEAIPIRLDDGRHLFMTVGRTKGGWFTSAPWVSQHGNEKNYQALEKGAVVPIDEGAYPDFVIFKDMKVPSTGRMYHVREKDDIGLGYGPARIFIRKTNNPPSERLLRYLPWASTIPVGLGDSLDPNIRGDQRCNPEPKMSKPCLGRRDFIRGWSDVQ